MLVQFSKVSHTTSAHHDLFTYQFLHISKNNNFALTTFFFYLGRNYLPFIIRTYGT